MATVATRKPTQQKRRSESTWARTWRRLSRHRLAMVSLVVLVILALAAILAPVIAPYNPYQQPRGAGLRAQFYQFPSEQHWLGTDDLGRDVFSRLLYGARVSLLVGVVAALSSTLVGTALGTLAGYFANRPFRLYQGPFNREVGGWELPFGVWRVVTWVLFYGALYLAASIAWQLASDSVQVGFTDGWEGGGIGSLVGLGVTWLTVAGLAVWGLWARFMLDLDVIISRLIDFIIIIPTLPILLVLSALLIDRRNPFGRWAQASFGTSASVFIIICILVVFGWTTTARLVRGSILSLREQDYTSAARALGVPTHQIMFKHLVPNALAPVIVDATLAVGIAILVEAALSFLGFGIQPPVATWGNMLTGAQNNIFIAPWLVFPPGIMIIITVLSINFLGDGLRDALDPKSRL